MTRIVAQLVFSVAVVCCCFFFLAGPTGFAQKPPASPDKSRDRLPASGGAADSGSCGCPLLPSISKAGKAVQGSVDHELDADTLEGIMSNREAQFGGWQPGLNALRLILEKKSPPAPVHPDIKLREGFLADELINDGRRTLPSARGGAARADAIAADKALLMNSLISTIARANKYGETQPNLRSTAMLVTQFITSDLIAAGNDRPFLRTFVRINRQALYAYIRNAGVNAARIEKARASHPTSDSALVLDLYDMANASLDVLMGNDKSVRPLARVTPTSRDDGEMLARDLMAAVQTRRQYGGDAVSNSPQDIIACRAFAALVQLASPPNGDPALRQAIFNLAVADLSPTNTQIPTAAGLARAAIDVAHAIGFGDAQEAASIAMSWLYIVLHDYNLSLNSSDPAWRERYAQSASRGVSILKWFEESNPNATTDFSSVVAQSNRDFVRGLRLRVKGGNGGRDEKLMADAYDTAIVTEHAGSGPVSTAVCANDRREPLLRTVAKPPAPDAGKKSVEPPQAGTVTDPNDIGLVPGTSREKIPFKQFAGVCGPDVTNKVLDGLELIIRDYNGAKPPSKKKSACWSLFNPFTANHAWDLTGGFGAVDAPDSNSTPAQIASGKYWLEQFVTTSNCAKPRQPCGASVQFLGHCIHAQVVNYTMWGLVTTLCDHYALGQNMHAARAKFKSLFGNPPYDEQKSMVEAGHYFASNLEKTPDRESMVAGMKKIVDLVMNNMNIARPERACQLTCALSVRDKKAFDGLDVGYVWTGLNSD